MTAALSRLSKELLPPMCSLSFVAIVITAVVMVVLGGKRVDTCIGEFQLCASGECVLNSKSCGLCSAGQYVCPISKSCANDADDYVNCPQLKGTHLDWELSIDERLDFLMDDLQLSEKYPQLTNSAPAIYRLGIPYYNWLNDDEHSARNAHSTVMPNGCGLGATWSQKDLNIAGHIIATEARALHNTLVHSGDRGQGQNGATITIYAPNMNLVRDPRWGRAQEVYSEDPRLSGHLTYAFVNGLQNGAAQDNKYLLTAACCKHFAAYDLETEPQQRYVFNALVSPLMWAETYSPVFHECVVRANAAHVMCSYNSINGIPSCANNHTMNTVLRERWGFEGFVVSDYDAMAQIYTTHRYVDSFEEAVAVSLKSGCDQEGGGTVAINQIPDAINLGLLSMDDVNLALSRLFRIRIRLGLFDPPTFVEYNQLSNDSSVEGPEHLAQARRIATHSMTLLKNAMIRSNGKVNGSEAAAPALPINRDDIKNLVVIGPQAIATKLLLGNYATYPDKGVMPILQGLRHALGENQTAECDISENTEFVHASPSNLGEYVYSTTECCTLCYQNDECTFWTFSFGDHRCWMSRKQESTRHVLGKVSGECTNKPNGILLRPSSSKTAPASSSSFSTKTSEAPATPSKIHYAYGCLSVSCPNKNYFESAYNLIRSYAEKDDLSYVLVGLGLDQALESEGHDRKYIELPGLQAQLIHEIALLLQVFKDLYHIYVPLVCYIVHGGTLSLHESGHRDDTIDVYADCDAILDAWYPGSQGALAFAEVVFGEVSPAGRTPVTWYQSTADLPVAGAGVNVMNEYGGKGVTYRYYHGQNKPLFPFGYGLSYTLFEYSNLLLNVSAPENGQRHVVVQKKTEKNGLLLAEPVLAYDYEISACDIIQASVTVTNVGGVDSDEVVQMYVKQRIDDGNGNGNGNDTAAVDEYVPIVRLGDFQRVFVRSGSNVKVNLVLTPRYYSVVNNETSVDWFTPDIQIEEGVFEIYVGGGQPDYDAGVLMTTVYVNSTKSFYDCPEQD